MQIHYKYSQVIPDLSSKCRINFDRVASAGGKKKWIEVETASVSNIERYGYLIAFAAQLTL